MIRWMLFSTLATGLLYGLYCLLFRKDRWLHISRGYLIVSLAFSLVYPLLQLPIIELRSTSGVVSGINELLAPIVVSANAYDATGGGVGWRGVLQMVYIGGVAVSVIVLLIQVGGQLGHLGKVRLTILDDETPPYSFFNHVVVGKKGLSEEELECVLTHEEVHVKQHHSIDVLMMRLMCCVAWYNPVVWLMLVELRRVHEYEADAAVLARYGRSGYLRLLYKQASGVGYGHITNNFNSLNIKNRITMMNRQKSRFGAWKLLVALPVALLLMVGCKEATTSDSNETVVRTGGEAATADGEILSEADVMPEYPGGAEAMAKYLNDNISYPEQAKADGVEGRVMVSFVVESDGSLTDAQVVRGIGGGCDEEAIRVVKGMPKWKAGNKGGTPVRVQYYLPIIFKLQ